MDQHVSDLCMKASRQINVLKRFSRILDVESKLSFFKSFVRSNFLYCPIIWHFCSQESSNKLEKIQERALRFVYGDKDSSYQDLVTKANVSTVKVLCLREIAIEVLKMIHRINPPVL